MIFRFFQQAMLALLLAAPPLAASAAVCELNGAEDAALQRQLTGLLETQGLGPAVRKGELAVSLLVLTDPERPRLAQVNGHRMMYAASLPKIAILLGAAVALDEGQLNLDSALEQDIQDMIRYSCNACSNRVLERVGPERVLDILQAPEFSFYDAAHGGGLWLGKAYGKAPAFHRDPLVGLSHGATTFQVARFYCGLEFGELVSPEQTQLMRDAMSEPGIRHKFVKGLAGHDELQMFRKSGTWRDFHADSMLVEMDGQAYVMVALARNTRGSAWMEHLAEPLHQLATSPPATNIVSEPASIRAITGPAP
jgi:beta-lactamase class A